MLIRSEQKLNDPKFTKVFVHIWEDLGVNQWTKVAVFHRDSEGNWKELPYEIGFASLKQLHERDIAYIQGKLAHKFLRERQMRVNKDKAQLVYRWEHPKYSKPVE